jgi:hypothetical protein
MKGAGLIFALCMSCLLSAQPEPPSPGLGPLVFEYTLYLLDSRWEQEGTKLEELDDFIEVEVDDQVYMVDRELIVSPGLDLDFLAQNIKGFIAPRSIGLDTPDKRRVAKNILQSYPLPLSDSPTSRVSFEAKLRIIIEGNNESWSAFVPLRDIFPELAGNVSLNGNMLQDHPLATEVLDLASKAQGESSLDAESSVTVLGLFDTGQRVNLMHLGKPVEITRALARASFQVREQFSNQAADELGLREYLALSFSSMDTDSLAQKIFKHLEHSRIRKDGLLH